MLRKVPEIDEAIRLFEPLACYELCVACLLEAVTKLSYPIVCCILSSIVTMTVPIVILWFFVDMDGSDELMMRLWEYDDSGAFIFKMVYDT